MPLVGFSPRLLLRVRGLSADGTRTGCSVQL